MLPITKSDRIWSWLLLAGFIGLVWRRMRRLSEIDAALDAPLLRFIQAGEAGQELIMRSERKISRR